MKISSKNSFKTLSTLNVDGKSYTFHDLTKLKSANVDTLPFAQKILLENCLRFEDGLTIDQSDIASLIDWDPKATPNKEIFFMPSRVLLQDFTGVPAVADLAAMRAAIERLGSDPNRVNPFTPADLVIDHSVQIDSFGSTNAFDFNTKKEFERNQERYQFLRWGQNAFNNFRVVPPDNGIVHQINLEYLANVVMTQQSDDLNWVYPDSLIGTDSHSTMINGLGILGWGVGGIEAEAALLGQPSSLLIPQTIGFKLIGKPEPGITATDLVLTITETLRKHGVVGRFVEFFGPGLSQLSLADRATIANMAPEYGATCGLFPIDKVTIDYLKVSGREDIAPLVEAYYKAQGLWYTDNQTTPRYTDIIEFDMTAVEPSLAGPKRPQDRVALADIKHSFRKALAKQIEQDNGEIDAKEHERFLDEGGSPTLLAPEFEKLDEADDSDVYNMCVPIRQPDGVSYNLCHGSVVIASITSCTNTSNPAVMLAAGLLARNAVRRGLKPKPWVKTSLAPGSKVVTDYLTESGLMAYLEGLSFHLVGYGCATCIGNSGPLAKHITKAIKGGDLAVASVLSGNRNFEGRVNALVRANYLASPPMVVAYALAGNLNIDLTSDPLGVDPNGKFVYLKDIWPEKNEIDEQIQQFVTAKQYHQTYQNIFSGSVNWSNLNTPAGNLFSWKEESTYIKEPPFFKNIGKTPEKLSDIKDARLLALLGDSVTTDHISPAGSFTKETPAGKYLSNLGVSQKDFNSYGSRRGNHEVMVRGTFANVRLRNQLAPGTEGGFTQYIPDSRQMTLYDASVKYQENNIDLIVIAGKEYGTGSSRDWAAKGPKLLGIKAVIAESFERIHRSNLVGMGILPLQFKAGETPESLGLTGRESYSITGLNDLIAGQDVEVKAKTNEGKVLTFKVCNRIDTPNEIEYFKNGGILSYVLRQILQS